MDTTASVRTPTEMHAEKRIRFDLRRGLSAEEAEQSRKIYGANRMTEKKKTGFVRQFFGNFSDPIIRILLASLVINIAVSFGHVNWLECIGIAAAILIATLVSTISEYSSAAAFETLCRKTDDSVFDVLRGGQWSRIRSSEIVVGDVVHLSPGCSVPADGILFAGEMRLDQSPLSGESAEKKKFPADCVRMISTEMQADIRWDPDQTDQLFCGSRVCSGEGEFLVMRVGDATFYGGVAADLQGSAPASPLKERLAGLARSVSFLGYVAAAVIAFAYLFNVIVMDSGMDVMLIRQKLTDWHFLLPELIHALTVAISVLVVAVPEGLPMMITVVLSSNMKKMLAGGVLVRRLVGIETAGSMNILFTDKTGTLTCGRLQVAEIAGAESVYDSYAALKKCPPLAAALRDNHAACAPQGQGNATDRALSVYFGRNVPQMPVVNRVPFDSARRYTSGCVQDADGTRTWIRGAPEAILPHVEQYLGTDGRLHPMNAQMRNHLKKEWQRLADSAHRVIAAAECVGCCMSETGNFPGLIFIALIGIRDRLRPDAVSSVTAARRAGIQTVMITGDNPLTAAAIARECGIINSETGGEVITGEAMAAMSDDDLEELLPRLAVVARALPADKSRLVRIAQKRELVVGMTGDGINDAPALRAADVGFAMGSGTDAAREASSIVITDDRFASIVQAVLFGRTVFRSIRKFIVFQLTMNLCAVGVSLIGPFIGVETPVTVIQMLWVNIIMDTLGALAFAGEPALKKYMHAPPLPRSEKLLSRDMIGRILGMGCFSLTLCLWFLKSPAMHRIFSRGDEVYYLTVFFALFIFCGIVNCFLSRAEGMNIFANLGKNPAFILIIAVVAVIQLMIIYFGGDVFRCEVLYGKEILIAALLACTVLPAELIRRGLRRK